MQNDLSKDHTFLRAEIIIKSEPDVSKLKFNYNTIRYPGQTTVRSLFSSGCDFDVLYLRSKIDIESCLLMVCCAAL